MSRNEFVSQCKDKTLQFFKDNYYILSYSRDKHGRKTGVVVVYKDKTDTQNNVKIGWSKCNTKEDTFDKYIGIQKALNETASFERLKDLTHNCQSLYNPTNGEIVPHSLKDMIVYTVERAAKYFK